jgi:DNA-binding response OmpR family regulator
LQLIVSEREGLVCERCRIAGREKTLSMKIWGNVPETRIHTLDRNIGGLRRKLGVYADQYVETVIGAGYRFRSFLVRR